VTNSDFFTENTTTSGAVSFIEPHKPQPQYASFGRRFIAYLLDSLFIATATFVVSTLIAKQIDWAKIGPEALLAYLWLLFGFYFTATLGYFTLMTAGKSGATIGKRLLGIKVTLADGSEVPYGRALARTIGYHISTLFLYIGFLIALIDKRHQTFHDKIVNTVVVVID